MFRVTLAEVLASGALAGAFIAFMMHVYRADMRKVRARRG